MQISSINSISNIQNFKGSSKKLKTDKSPKQIKIDRKRFLFALGGLAAAGAVTAGIIINARKNKMPKLGLDKLKSAAQPVEDKAAQINDIISETVEKQNAENIIDEIIPQELTIKNFKLSGKFDKGNAIYKGKPYSGIIEVPVEKDGNKFVNNIEYADGILKSSTKYRVVENIDEVGKNALSDFVLVSKKAYSNEDGKKIIDEYALLNTFSKAPTMSQRTTIKPNEIETRTKNPIADIIKTIKNEPNGNISTVIQKPCANSDGRWQYVTTDLKTGETLNIQDMQYNDPRYPYDNRKTVFDKISDIFKR